MSLLDSYEYYIFDCDGVILDSNKLKINAMKDTLDSLLFSPDSVLKCIEYFSGNFGKSRFHHVDVFVDEMLFDQIDSPEEVKENILNVFSEKCGALYLEARVTPGFIGFIERLKGRKYIASGSEQKELRDVLSKRGLDKYFYEIYGSPTRKSEIVSNIVSSESSLNAIMFGDAISDFEAARENNIDFCAYLPYSNVKELIRKKALEYGSKALDFWPS